ncbi:MAG TPA: hypothetical protein VF979_02250, partial [Streptosporangiaceae bacterium]
FEGGFLGMDNISVFDRSDAVPPGHRLEQSDATSWMAVYCLAMLDIALELARVDSAYDDLATKFLEHFVAIGVAAQTFGSGNVTLWDEEDGFCYDTLIAGDHCSPVRIRSMVGLIPLMACSVLPPEVTARAPDFAARLAWLERHRPADLARVLTRHGDGTILLSLLDEPKLARVLRRMLDEAEFLSPYGLRALSAYHREHPYQIEVEGVTASIDYEPAESTTPMFGGNSNWRGPLWFPLNYLVISALERYRRFFGDDFTIEYPTGSGAQVTLDKVAADLQDRLIALFTRSPDGRRPCFGGNERLQDDPAWRDNIVFGEYFHGDNGAALGASHQTGWTGLIADVIRRRYGQVRSVGEIVRIIEQEHRA